MTKDEETAQSALKLALEALELSSITVDNFSVQKKTQEAIAAVREARAEQPAQQEPCGWQFYQEGKWHNGMETNNHRANTEAAGVPVRDVYPSPQPAQPLAKSKSAAQTRQTPPRFPTPATEPAASTSGAHR